MKLFLLLLVLIYIFGLLFLYVDLPEKIIEEEGMLLFYSCTKYDCAKIFLDFANLSQETKCAFYDLNEPRMVSYFKENDKNLILYTPNNDYGIGTSIELGGLMHHKFCVFDNQITLTGSWNPTLRGTEKNDNYVLILVSETISQNFLKEYSRLESKTMRGTQGLTVNLSGTIVSTCFSPNNHCEEYFFKEISEAKNKIDFLAFSFTNQKIADFLINATARNVVVDVLFEKTRISKYSTYHKLNASNVNVFLDTNPYTMHEKLVLIDENVAILGSYNPSSSAEINNDENLIILKNLKRDFLDEINDELQRIKS